MDNIDEGSPRADNLPVSLSFSVLESTKIPGLRAPKTHGQLEEFLNRTMNHPGRYANTDSPDFQSIQNDERFLLFLRTTKVHPSTPLPKEAIEGSNAIIRYLEPRFSIAERIRSGITFVSNRLSSGYRKIIGGPDDGEIPKTA